MSSNKKGSGRESCYKLQKSFWYQAVAELKSFGFSFVVVGQQDNFNFILVSHFQFGIFWIMTEIVTLAAFFSFWSLRFVFLAFVYFTVSPLSNL